MSEPTSSRPAPGDAYDGRRRRWPRRAFIAAGVLALLGVLAVLPAVAARGRFEAGRAELLRARDLLGDGDLSSARSAFARSETAFADAGGWSRSPVLWAIGQIPLLGRSADAVTALASAGQLTAEAGVELTAAIDALPAGIQALAPRGGHLPLRTIAGLHPAAAAALRDLEAALGGLESLPTSFLVGPVAEARDRSLRELPRAVQAARAAEALTRALPEFAGASGQRRYFVAFQSPAELRGTGGFAGAYSILTASGGKLVMGPTRSIHDLPDLPPDLAPAPPVGFGEPYSRFGGPGFWSNLNMVPDAPTAAELIEALFERVTGKHVDGVLFVDPQALGEMLQATGPVRPPGFDRTLEAGTVVDYLANEAYLQFGDQAERKRVLGAASRVVWRRFMDGTDPLAAFRALADAAGGGHLIVHSTDPEVQTALAAAGIAGAVEDPTGNLFAVFGSNADGTKVDYYLQRDLRYEVELGADGRATAEATISTTNGAPVGAEPSYVLGPHSGLTLEPGESRAFVTTYCAPGCALTGSSLDGAQVGVEAHTDRGLPLFATYVRTDPGASSALRLAFSQPGAWEGGEFGGAYLITILGQPMIEPTTATLIVDVPPGMRIVDTSVPMQIDGRRASWSGTIGREQRYVIRFQEPFPTRLWTQVRELLTRSIFRL